MSYAKNTTVPIERTVGEIKRVLEKAGADGFAYAEIGNAAKVMFRVAGRGIMMSLRYPMPPSANATEASKKTFEQIKKSKWRALLLCIKAKVESVESGIETFEEAFLPHMVLKNGETVGRTIIPKIEQLNETPPALLLGL